MKATKMFVLRVWIMLMFLIAIPSVNQTTASAAVTKKYTATYVSTVDGDTAYLKVGKKTYSFRFLAVDTPEIEGACYYAQNAKEYVEKRLENAEIIQVQYETSAKTDKYGRKLAWIFVDGKLLQSDLVKNGYARVYYLYGNYKYNTTLKKQENAAKNKNKGVWKKYSSAFPKGDDGSGKVPTSTKPSTSSKPQSSTVYVSRTGTKYHRSASCSNMKSPLSMSRSDAVSRGYGPCSKCY